MTTLVAIKDGNDWFFRTTDSQGSPSDAASPLVSLFRHTRTDAAAAWNELVTQPNLMAWSSVLHKESDHEKLVQHARAVGAEWMYEYRGPADGWWVAMLTRVPGEVCFEPFDKVVARAAETARAFKEWLLSTQQQSLDVML